MGKMSVASVLEMIESDTAPSRMTARQALEYLEEIQTELDGRIDGLKDDVKAEGEGRA